MTIDELKQAQRVAYKALLTLQDEVGKKQRLLIAAQETRIKAEIRQEYGERLKYLRATHEAAALALTEAVESISKTGIGCSVPLGTRLVKWEAKRWPHKGLYVVTAGIVEAVTRDTIHPTNQTSHSRADIGRFIIRHLKKDGAPGIKYDVMGGFTDHKLNNYDYGKIPRGWYPEGVDPNV